jgi:hypothetical protein
MFGIPSLPCGCTIKSLPLVYFFCKSCLLVLHFCTFLVIVSRSAFLQNFVQLHRKNTLLWKLKLGVYDVSSSRVWQKQFMVTMFHWSCNLAMNCWIADAICNVVMNFLDHLTLLTSDTPVLLFKVVFFFCEVVQSFHENKMLYNYIQVYLEPGWDWDSHKTNSSINVEGDVCLVWISFSCFCSCFSLFCFDFSLILFVLFLVWFLSISFVRTNLCTKYHFVFQSSHWASSPWGSQIWGSKVFLASNPLWWLDTISNKNISLHAFLLRIFNVVRLFLRTICADICVVSKGIYNTYKNLAKFQFFLMYNWYW